jgi:hypothetical protein
MKKSNRWLIIGVVICTLVVCSIAYVKTGNPVSREKFLISSSWQVCSSNKDCELIYLNRRLDGHALGVNQSAIPDVLNSSMCKINNCSLENPYKSDGHSFCSDAAACSNGKCGDFGTGCSNF